MANLNDSPTLHPVKNPPPAAAAASTASAAAAWRVGAVEVAVSNTSGRAESFAELLARKRRQSLFQPAEHVGNLLHRGRVAKAIILAQHVVGMACEGGAQGARQGSAALVHWAVPPRRDDSPLVQRRHGSQTAPVRSYGQASAASVAECDGVWRSAFGGSGSG